MGNIISMIETYTQEYFDYGLFSRCPNCNNRTILSYPITQCTKCQNRFKNDIIVVNNYNRFYRHGKSTFNQYDVSNKLVLNGLSSFY